MLFGADFFNFISLFLHLSSSGSFPKVLTATEEDELVLKKTQGDMPARNKLIEHNLRLVAHIVKKYVTQPTDQDDLISIGTIGLIKGIDTFNGKKGVRLATYASRCIENEILMYFRALKKISCEISIDEPIDTDKEGDALTLNDILFCDDNIVERIDYEMKSDWLREAIIKHLTKRERSIVEMRYGLVTPYPKTQMEVAEALDISRSYVSRIEKAALEKLKRAKDMQGQED